MIKNSIIWIFVISTSLCPVFAVDQTLAQIEYWGPWGRFEVDEVACEDPSQPPTAVPFSPTVEVPLQAPLTAESLGSHHEDFLAKIKIKCEETGERSSGQYEGASKLYVATYEPFTFSAFQKVQTHCLLTQFSVSDTQYLSCAEKQSGINDGNYPVDLVVDQFWRGETIYRSATKCHYYYAVPKLADVYQVSARIQDCKIDCGDMCSKFEADEGTLTQTVFDRCLVSEGQSSTLFAPAKVSTFEEKFVAPIDICPFKRLVFSALDKVKYSNVCNPQSGLTAADPFAGLALYLGKECAAPTSTIPSGGTPPRWPGVPL